MEKIMKNFPKTNHKKIKDIKNVFLIKNYITKQNIEIGDYTYYSCDNEKEAINFENNNILFHDSFLEDKLIIGKFCSIAKNTKFIMNASHHNYSSISTYPFYIFLKDKKQIKEFLKYDDIKILNKGNTNIGHDVWFGYNCTIKSGINIGNGAVIAMNSVVTKDVPPYAIVGGNPAKIIKYRFSEEEIKIIENLKWWDWTVEKISKNFHQLSLNFNKNIDFAL